MLGADAESRTQRPRIRISFSGRADRGARRGPARRGVAGPAARARARRRGDHKARGAWAPAPRALGRLCRRPPRARRPRTVDGGRARRRLEGVSQPRRRSSAVGNARQRGGDRRRHRARDRCPAAPGTADPPRPRPDRTDHDARRHPGDHPGAYDPRPRCHAPAPAARTPARPGGEHTPHGRRLSRCSGPSADRPPRSEHAPRSTDHPHPRHDHHQECARGAVPPAVRRRRPAASAGETRGSPDSRSTSCSHSSAWSSRPMAGATTAPGSTSSATATATRP
jgi:hypothetical protein